MSTNTSAQSIPGFFATKTRQVCTKSYKRQKEHNFVGMGFAKGSQSIKEDKISLFCSLFGWNVAEKKIKFYTPRKIRGLFRTRDITGLLDGIYSI
ncbi:hypothetical protein PGH07_01605 [Sulfurovum sp. zt1-1]|uniref:Uncharacterized protein n=1 Tax=Sulfurovum zhangzhouensis TaxID=3019067 RepID=A0ABT7QVK6_9BACT|nr:hypothetical protein [Sulfurovum zhangzhouensis]MDM5270869.1 hypothetical protein [Sulfurovum zhangzhouensis]